MPTIEEINKNISDINASVTGISPNLQKLGQLSNVIQPEVIAKPQPKIEIPRQGEIITPSVGMDVPKQEDQFKLFKSYLEQQEAPQDTADIYSKALTDTGFQDKQKAVNDLSAELAQINADTKQAEIQLSNTTMDRQESLFRNQLLYKNAAYKALPVQAQLAAAQGNLSLATDRLNTLFKLRSDDAKNKYEYRQNLIDKFYDFASKEQQAKLDEKKLKEQREFDLTKDYINQAQSLANTAIANGYPKVASQIMALDPKSPTYQQDVAGLAGQIKPKATSSQITTIKSGGLVIPESAIAQGQQVLDSVKGQDGYVYTPKYLEMLKAWKEDGGLEQDFFTNYPPKNYLNPSDSTIPKYIKDKLKTDTESSFDSF